MLFKRKEWRTAPWWGQAQKAQRKYARRLADRLNRKIAGMSRELVRQYVVACLIGMAALNGALAVHIIRQHRAGSVSSSLTRWEFPAVLPIKGRALDDKLYDSLKKERPGLADSLKILESIY